MSIVASVRKSEPIMLKHLVIAVGLLTAPVLAGSSAIPLGVHTGDLNRQIEACTDFYEFASGKWRVENPIPAGKPRWSRRLASNDANSQRQRSVLEEVSKKKDWPAGSSQQVVGDHYAACMNETAVDAADLTPLSSLLAEIDAVHNAADVQRIIIQAHQLAIPVAFTASTAPGFHDPLHFVANFAAGGLGMPDRDYYLKQEPRFVAARAEYLTHVAQLLAMAGTPQVQADAAAGNILALEKRLAAASMDSTTASDPVATDHVMSFAQLKQLAPHFDWDRYFTAARLPLIDLNIAEPKFFEQLDQEFRDAPVEIWKVYLKWQTLESAAPSLSRRFAEESFNFLDKFLNSAAAMKPRAQRCVESADALFGDALAKSYMQVYFPPASKAKAEGIIRNLRAALKEQLLARQWMEPGTKKIALEKIAATNVQVGYPDKWKDYGAVRVKRDTFWADVAAGRKFDVDYDRRLVGKATGRDFWVSTPSPSSTGAYILVELNKVVLPAGALQPPFFDPQANDAVIYGAFGVTIAHDLTHFIDTLGAANDIAGNPKNWWTETDRQSYEKHSECLVDQFNGYFIEPGVHHDGKRVLSESTADLGGMRIAYMALEKSVKSRPLPTVDGFTPEQQFFIAWGQTNGGAMRIEAQRELVSSDPHPTPKFRVIAPLSNTPEFQQAFACKVGAAMVRPPEKRCAW